MPKNRDPKSIDQLMAEADDLIRQINADALKDMEEAHRLEFEKHAQKLEKIKSGIQDKAEQKEIWEKTSGADGMHAAILDIVGAFQDLKNKIF
jgi:capsule polysaccharide export protein KpsE/RkpR